MNDFPDLVPPPERSLTAAQRDRMRAALAEDEVRERPWLVPTIAAAAVLVVLAGGLALSRSLDGSDSGSHPVQAAGGGPAGNPIPMGDDATLCLGSPRQPVVMMKAVQPERDLVMTGAALRDPRGASSSGAWYALQPPGAVAVGGAFVENLPGRSKLVDREWRQRKPLAGAVLEGGAKYTFFVRVSVDLGGQFDGIAFSYRDARSSGTSVMDLRVAAHKNCS
ncbi:MAG: hypothetical protein ACJ716_15960 [Marmoricola sp.]